MNTYSVTDCRRPLYGKTRSPNTDTFINHFFIPTKPSSNESALSDCGGDKAWPNWTDG